MATAIQEIPLRTIDGKDASLGDYAGKVLLAVNVASKCGLTPQYAALEETYRKYRDKGFAVLGFPANNFGAQEPGSEAEITEFCTTNFGVDFPMFAKISVKGDDQHPLYQTLTEERPTKTYKDDSFKQRLIGYGIDVGAITYLTNHVDLPHPEGLIVMHEQRFRRWSRRKPRPHPGAERAHRCAHDRTLSEVSFLRGLRVKRMGYQQSADQSPIAASRRPRWLR